MLCRSNKVLIYAKDFIKRFDKHWLFCVLLRCISNNTTNNQLNPNEFLDINGSIHDFLNGSELYRTEKHSTLSFHKSGISILIVLLFIKSYANSCHHNHRIIGCNFLWSSSDKARLKKKSSHHVGDRNSCISNSLHKNMSEKCWRHLIRESVLAEETTDAVRGAEATRPTQPEIVPTSNLILKRERTDLKL